MPKIRTLTISVGVKVSRNFQTSSADASVEFVFSEDEAPETVREAMSLLRHERIHMAERVREEADGNLTDLLNMDR